MHSTFLKSTDSTALDPPSDVDESLDSHADTNSIYSYKKLSRRVISKDNMAIRLRRYREEHR